MTKKRASSFETGKIFLEDITNKLSTYVFYPITGAFPEQGREEYGRGFEGYNEETAVRVSSGFELPIGSFISYASFTPTVKHFLDLFYNGYFFDMLKAMGNVEVLCFIAGTYMAVEGAIRLGCSFDKEHDYKLLGSLPFSAIYYSVKAIKGKWSQAEIAASKPKRKLREKEEESEEEKVDLSEVLEDVLEDV